METISIARSKFRNPAFRNALTKLSDCPNLDTKVAYNLMVLLRKIDQASVSVASGWKEVITEIAAMDEKGEPKVDLELGEFVWKAGVTAEDAKRRIMGYSTSVIELDRHKFTLADLEGAALSASELGALEDIYLGM